MKKMVAGKSSESSASLRPAPADGARQELIELTRRLLESIGSADWAAYEALCDPTLSAFEPEGRGALIEGLEFHRYYFESGQPAGPRNTTIAHPHVRMLGPDAGVVSYTRLTQKLDSAGSPVTVPMEETRVWQRIGGRWRHVHFHRSPPGGL